MRLIFLIVSLTCLLAACATPDRYDDINYSNKEEFITHPKDIIITKDDITDRPYEIIEDLQVSFSKTTLFHEDPTPAHIDSKLKYMAAKLGADAVILVRYGTVGISLTSWGSLEGKGRAIKFVK